MGHFQLRILYDSVTDSTKQPVFLTDRKVKDEKHTRNIKLKPLASNTSFFKLILLAELSLHPYKTKSFLSQSYAEKSKPRVKPTQIIISL